jgi:hypothetical protein
LSRFTFNDDFLYLSSHLIAGDLVEAKKCPAGSYCPGNNVVTSCPAGTYNPTSGAISNVIDYIEIATTGNATDFGDLSVSRMDLGGVS